MSDSPLFLLCFSDLSYFLFPVTSAVNNICFGPRLEGPRAAARARPSGGSATATINQNKMKIRIIICIILLKLNKSNYYYR